MAGQDDWVNPTTYITLGGKGVGDIMVNPADVRGEGGAAQPALVVPITVRMNPHPKEEQIGMLLLEARLAIGTTPSSRQVGLVDRHDLRPGMHVVSVPDYSPSNGVDLRFVLTPAAVEEMDRHRHASGGSLQLCVGFKTVLAWVRAYNEVVPGAPGDPKIPFAPLYGMLADTTIFWSSQVGDLVFAVEQSTWVDKVLPNVGHDDVRLIEVRLPIEMDDADARAAFGRQLRNLDTGAYHQSVAASRALLHAWEKRLGALPKNRPVAQVIAESEGWAPDDPRRTFLDSLWAAAKDMANAAHHEADQAALVELGEPESRTHLLVTAALSEWLGRMAGNR
jgi:hypothetical protein